MGKIKKQLEQYYCKEVEYWGKASEHKLYESSNLKESIWGGYIRVEFKDGSSEYIAIIVGDNDSVEKLLFNNRTPNGNIAWEFIEEEKVKGKKNR